MTTDHNKGADWDSEVDVLVVGSGAGGLLSALVAAHNHADVLVTRPDQPVTEADVRAAYEQRLARFKHPRRLVFMDTLPKTALGKVQKPALVRVLVGSPQAKD